MPACQLLHFQRESLSFSFMGRGHSPQILNPPAADDGKQRHDEYQAPQAVLRGVRSGGFALSKSRDRYRVCL
jgi:hypothetical protein